MKKILFVCIAIFAMQISYAQTIYEISLTNEYIYFKNRSFYIESVKDNREDKANIGFVQKGAFNKVYEARLQNGLEWSLQKYFNYSILPQENKTPITIIVSKFSIGEVTKFTSEYATVDVTFDFYNKNTLLHTSNQHVEVSSGIDVTSLHEENIRQALKKTIVEFVNSGWAEKLPINENLPDSLFQATNSVTQVNTPVQQNSNASEITDNQESRNATAIGYQLGGLTLIGIEREIRITDILGLNAGIGLAGFTFGAKFHTNYKKNSPFYMLSYKDAGFGAMSTFAAEYGTRLSLSSSSDFCFLIQVGLMKILSITPEAQQALFKEATKIPAYIFSFGVGFGW